MRKKVVIIGVDGMRADALLAARTPRIDALARDGIYSWNAQTELRTVSGPAWTALLTGVHQEKHGVDGNENMAMKRRVPTFLARVKAWDPATRIVARCNWAPIITEIIEPGILEVQGTGTDDQVAADLASDINASKGDVYFIQLDQIDAAGHLHGYSPNVPGYLEAIERVDALVGLVIDAIDLGKVERGEPWLTCLVSDHGGSGKGHGAPTAGELTIAFVISGETVHPKGAIPGEEENAPQIVDIVPTVARFLGMPADPAWDGTAR